MKLIQRLLSRSGELVFDPVVDTATSEDMRLHWLEDWLGPRLRDARVADVGCWTGGILRWAVDVGARTVTGIDLEGPWLEVARQRVPIAQMVPVASLPHLDPSLDGQFDLLFFLETMEHLPRGTERATLGRLSRLLATGGQLVLSTPVAGPMTLLDPAWLLVGHRHYSLARLRRLLSAAGLGITEVRWSGNLWSAMSTNVMYLEKHLLRRPPTAYRRLEERGNTGLRPRPTATATTIWIRATATP